jgi:hypothetical protein
LTVALAWLSLAFIVGFWTYQTIWGSGWAAMWGGKS